MSNGIYLFNQLYAFVSLLAVILSLGFFADFKRQFGLKIAFSILCGSLLSQMASLIPSLAFVLTISFIPSFIYHMIEPLALAPFVCGIIGFVATWCALTLMVELFKLFRREQELPRISKTVTAFFVFIFICYALRGGISGYQIVFHAQQISRYAPTGNDPKRLKEIYMEAVQSHDTKMFADVILLLALNHNLSADMLNELYIKTNNSGLNSISRNRIFRTLTKNPNTSSDLFTKLMFALSQTKTLAAGSETSNYISEGQHFSQTTLQELSEYPDCEIRRAIISYPDISEDVLVKMVKQDPDVGVRHDAKKRLDFIRGVNHLENNTPKPEILKTPVMASSDEITSIYSLPQLAKIFEQTATAGGSALVLENLANNCYINDDLVRKIYSRAEQFKNYSRTAILKALASNPRTPAEILVKLSAEKDLAILRQLASNPNLPLVLMAKLAPYPDCKIRKKIICIPGASGTLLRRFRHDADESVVVEANERWTQEEDYLSNCVEIKKLNPSCQKYFSTRSPDMRIYPNTSEREDFLPVRLKNLIL